MKIPEPRKLPSGSWNIRVQIDGQIYSITKPTKKACTKEAMALKSGAKEASKAAADMTLEKAIKEYIADRENVLSPSTIAGYRVIQRNRFQSLQKLKLSAIDAAKWQRAVNQEAETISAKTLKNSAMFVQTVIYQATGRRIVARLPQVVPNDLPWLTPEQIPTFLAAIKGSRYEIPALLALSGLRQSEIVAMQYKDIDLKSGVLRVTGAAVKNDDGELIQKQTNKNLSSRRTVPFLIPRLRELIAAANADPEAYVYPHYSNVLRLNINKMCAAAGLPEVGVHGLRRSFASLCYHLGISEAVTMLAGGWSDIHTMRKIYTKISEADIAKQGEIFQEYFQKLE